MRDLLRHAFASARWSIEGVTDEEAFWEPVAACWTVRRRDDGTWRADGGWPQPDLLPITTVAWRVVQLAGWTDVYRDWTFGGETLGFGEAGEAGEVS